MVSVRAIVIECQVENKFSVIFRGNAAVAAEWSSLLLLPARKGRELSVRSFLRCSKNSDEQEQQQALSSLSQSSRAVTQVSDYDSSDGLPAARLHLSLCQLSSQRR